MGRILKHDIYAHTKLTLLGHSNGCCSLCAQQEEMLNHILKTCSFATDCWTKLTRKLSNSASCQTLASTSSFLDHWWVPNFAYMDEKTITI